MTPTFNDKLIAYLALFSGLAISGVAEYYSIMGLIAIYPAAFWPIVIMGVVLGLGKITGTVWLKQNSDYAPVFLKVYILPAIIVLMMITSLGVFGFLSKAHSDQSLVSADVQAKIAVYDEKIKVAKENIDANRKALRQMDEAVDQVMGRSQDEKGADKAVALRRGQAKERTRLLSEIAAEQKTIAKLSEERAPIAAEVRKVEAEVGPIKYIAALIYGDNPDNNLLERAVRWVIIIIVGVFDPLAVILLLSSQYSFQWFRDEKDKELETTESDIPEKESNVVSTDTIAEQEPVRKDPHPVGWAFPKHANIQDYRVEDEEPKFNEIKPLDQWNEMIAEAEAAAEKEDELEEEEILNSVQAIEKAAMTAWKKDNPDSSLKIQRRLFERGLISKLPWEDYIADAQEAQKWAEENPETVEAIAAEEWAKEKILTAGIDERPGDYINPVTYMENVDGHQVTKTIEGYQQNAEQGAGTIWQRIQDAKK